MTTSADAAIRYCTPDGHVEVRLIEWKFTEDYRDHELRPPRGAPRIDRYRALWEASDCPARHDLVPYEDLFVEPFYQLLRQQFLAERMERAGELGAERVVVIHVCPQSNDGVHRALNRDSHQAAGADVLEIWRQMCLRRDRFTTIDSSSFNHLRNAEFASRYDCAIQ